MAVLITAVGPTAERTWTVPDADCEILTDHDLVTVPQGGTGKATLTAHGVLVGEGTAAVAATAAGAANTVLHGAGGSADPAFSSVVEGDLGLTDITTNDVSTSKHGFAPKAPNDATKYLNGTGAYSVPRPAPLVVAITSNGTPTPNVDITDLYDITALAVSAAFGNPSGTPANGQKLLIRIKDNATAQALTWGSAYVAGGTALPSTTVLSKILTIGFIYNTANSLNKWQCVGAAQEA